MIRRVSLHDGSDEVGEVGARANLELRDLVQELLLEAIVPDRGRDIQTRQGRALLACWIYQPAVAYEM